jgi:hypothetical protein
MARGYTADPDMPVLTIDEVSRVYQRDGELVTRAEWAIVSDEEQKPLTETQAREILAAYLAVKELLKGRGHSDR